jgi:hypothetical protein
MNHGITFASLGDPIVYRDGVKLRQVPLECVDQASQLQATREVDRAGVCQVIAFANDPPKGDMGGDKTTFILTE